MNKLIIALVAGSMSVAVAGAYAAQGNPADSDKAGRMGPGSAAGQMGAADPNAPSKAGAKGGAGASATTGTGGAAATGAGGSASTGTGASATTGAGGASATSGSGMDDTKKGRRARRAAKG